MAKLPVVCIVGPTASGKTALSLALAKTLGGEIVSADSMQIYQDLNIGTAKPTLEEQAQAKHHMIDVVSPFEDYSVARYVEEAERCIADIHKRGKLPIVVGGTGLYVDSLMRGATFAAQVEDPHYRAEMEALAAREGKETLLALLSEVDPVQAQKLHVNDVKRVIRALEVYHTTGKRISEHNEATSERPERYRTCWLGLTYHDRAKLYERIDRRVDLMLADGLVEELIKIQRKGIAQNATAMQAIGYKELWDVPNGEPVELASERLKQATRRYAKRQLTWFRRNSKIYWIEADLAENFDAIIQESTDFIQSCGIMEVPFC
ncbi:MAG: tRNA (adenosine(37)-N6)-dimethylallyltransferase MiaA [Oscillospiraceae bacterium]|nr:tRNA (adenosine(37)-N6)-dimethylallyltransferase MiaA [Oscillospiraceae bacterium]